jgi:hypothetical protein
MELMVQIYLMIMKKIKSALLVCLYQYYRCLQLDLNILEVFSYVVPPNDSEARSSTSSQSTTISFDQKNITKDKLPLTVTSKRSEKNRCEFNLTFLRQLLKSRLTTSQLILLILNIVGVLTFILLIALFAKGNHPPSGILYEIEILYPSLCLDMLLVQTSTFFGNTLGGDDFNDAQDCQLNFSDKIVSIQAGWSSDSVDYVTFFYSNGESMQHGRQV